eukprot:gnl/TRDRNA2_/TRDRNA2_39012_c0_seq1.p1 gnl/TRDRNA2_/TRDRNA2_39012_c0~~gnl/TRDRNA2_/TRDRNA2_39012_c0_seq1.p1  ORF type:complete len:296 (+),score=66.07 gnl/TRDRNA2_/TRDRNA2_39012_c0_seq1:61-888(+)
MAASAASGAKPLKEVARDVPRGHIGDIFEDLFQDLYQDEEPSVSSRPASAKVSSVDVADRGPEGGKQDEDVALPTPASAQRHGGIADNLDLTSEDAEICAVLANLETEQERLGGVVDYLRNQKDQADQQDYNDAAHLQERWGLAVRTQIPLPESSFRQCIDEQVLERERLVIPRHVMTTAEREAAKPQPQENLLSAHRSALPTYLQPKTGLEKKALPSSLGAQCWRDATREMPYPCGLKKQSRKVLPPLLPAEASVTPDPEALAASRHRSSRHLK